MVKAISLLAMLSAALAAGGCTSDEFARYQGVTPYAGNAIASNTVLQMVDPWPRGVENTNLDVPADHKQYQTAASDGAPPATVSNTSTTNH
jgi:hypothetical protein